MKNFSFKNIFSTPFFQIESTHDKIYKNDPYYRIKSQNSVICCVLNTQDEILLVKQMRPNLNYTTIEFPAGGVEEGESSYEAVSREVLEELGVKCNFFYLGKYRLLMNRTTSQEYLYFGILNDEIIRHSENNNEIEVIKVPRLKFSKFIANKQFEQLAGLGIVKLIDLKFNINFLEDENILDNIVR